MAKTIDAHLNNVNSWLNFKGRSVVSAAENIPVAGTLLASARTSAQSSFLKDTPAGGVFNPSTHALESFPSGSSPMEHGVNLGARIAEKNWRKGEELMKRMEAGEELQPQEQLLFSAYMQKMNQALQFAAQMQENDHRTKSQMIGNMRV
jgi:hypothetical protein